MYSIEQGKKKTQWSIIIINKENSKKREENHCFSFGLEIVRSNLSPCVVIAYFCLQKEFQIELKNLSRINALLCLWECCFGKGINECSLNFTAKFIMCACFLYANFAFILVLISFGRFLFLNSREDAMFS